MYDFRLNLQGAEKTRGTSTDNQHSLLWSITFFDNIFRFDHLGSWSLEPFCSAGSMLEMRCSCLFRREDDINDVIEDGVVEFSSRVQGSSNYFYGGRALLLVHVELKPLVEFCLQCTRDRSSPFVKIQVLCALVLLQ